MNLVGIAIQLLLCDYHFDSSLKNSLRTQSGKSKKLKLRDGMFYIEVR